MRELLDRHLGDGLARPRRRSRHLGAASTAIPDEELWAVRGRQRAEFVDYVRGKSVLDRLGRGEPRQLRRGGGRARSTRTC